MYIKSFASLRCVLATLLLCLPASAGWARGDAGVSVESREAEASAPAIALADQIDALLADRFEAADNVPAADARRRALEDLSQFAAMTVEGLIDASPSGETRALLDARLRPILAHHQHAIAAALAGERPSAQNGTPASSGTDFPRVANAP
jgi:hypothetical protein